MRFVFIALALIGHVQATPLFDENSAELLAVEIEADMRKIRDEKSTYHSTTENFVDGQLRLDGRRFNARVQTAGHNRLSACEFPPLRIRLKETETDNSVFEGNHNLRIVTHCRDDGLQALFREHLIYKMYNLITPYSFRVRLFKVNYLDAGRPENAATSFAFFIESDGSVERRLGLTELKSDSTFNLKTYTGVSGQWLNARQAKLQEAFQHLIRNHDWVIFHAGPPNSLSLANIKVFYDDREGFPFPHDFDLAGVVTWNPSSLADRYDEESRCDDTELKMAFRTVLDHVDEFTRLVQQDPYLDSDYKERMAAHLARVESAEGFCSTAGNVAK